MKMISYLFKIRMLGIFTALFLLSPFAFAQVSESTLDDFSKDSLDNYPKGWSTYPFQGGKVKKVYKVQEENGERFIRARDDQDISMPIFKEFPWSLSASPTLSWKWRAQELPKGAREDNRATNDSACGVYVVFGKTSGVALKYVWSSSLPVGYVWEKEPGKFYVIVLASGTSNLGKWETEKVNVLEDYKKYFKKDPKKDPSGVGIMSDANATHSVAACDYTGFKVLN